MSTASAQLRADIHRKEISPGIPQKKKSALGQFMTPMPTATFMASLFPDGDNSPCVLLDAGAGLGALSTAFVARWQAGEMAFSSLSLHAFEYDDHLREHLGHTLAGVKEQTPFDYTVKGGDFIEHAAKGLLMRQLPPFTHAILNPPYKKISSDSFHRMALRNVSIETVNLYSAFVALAIKMLVPGGHLVAIIPRSFCNGPYYKPFRDLIFAKTAIKRIHLFSSRSKAFKDDSVLQENVIIVLEKEAPQPEVVISTSSDDTFQDLALQSFSFEAIVPPHDPERCIHIPTETETSILETSSKLSFTLAKLGITVSTGPVVDFRLKEHLSQMPVEGSVPLLYPAHFSGMEARWPVEGKKPNAILMHPDVRKWLMPTGFYPVVRRFSSKEERKRIVASLVTPSAFPEASLLGFENHLNVFHMRKQGMSRQLALGLVIYLNWSAVDAYFREFNGHTQVNATDLRLLPYPDRETLELLGTWAAQQALPSQVEIDHYLNTLFA